MQLSSDPRESVIKRTMAATVALPFIGYSFHSNHFAELPTHMQIYESSGKVPA